LRRRSGKCGYAPSLSSLVRIPRELLHIGFDDLTAHGVPPIAADALRALLADLPLVPAARDSAQLIGARAITLPCLAVLARHVVQGLRDHNLSLAHDRPRLRAERRKLLFLDSDAFRAAEPEAVVCIVDATAAIVDPLIQREATGLASFVATEAPLEALRHWRQVSLKSTS
jgi:hypothetical protein